jgi:hypothetical protein
MKKHFGFNFGLAYAGAAGLLKICLYRFEA